MESKSVRERLLAKLPEEERAGAELLIKRLAADFEGGVSSEEGRLSHQELRFIADYFYHIQKLRIRLANQAGLKKHGGRQKGAGGEAEPRKPETVSLFAHKMRETMLAEEHCKLFFNILAEADPICHRISQIIGIGPVLSALLRSQIDLHKTNNPSDLYSFAGLNPEAEWIGRGKAAEVVKILKTKYSKAVEAIEEAAQIVKMRADTVRRFAEEYAKPKPKKGAKPVKSTKRYVPTWPSLEKSLARIPWNARLKTICYNIGISFMKVSGNRNSYFGMVYRATKEKEEARNDNKGFADLAQSTLASKNITDSKTKSAYKKGRLPDGRIFMRAIRKAEKRFLNYFYEVAYEAMYKKTPPLPYHVAKMQHTSYSNAAKMEAFERGELSASEMEAMERSERGF